MVELLEGLKDVGLISLAISNTGVGVSSGGKLAELLSGATKFSATVIKIDIRGNDLSVESLATLKGAAPEGCEVVVKK